MTKHETLLEKHDVQKLAVDAQIAFCLTHYDSFEEALVRKTEQAVLTALAEKAEPDCYAVLTPNGSKLVSPQEAKGSLNAYPLYAHPPTDTALLELTNELLNCGDDYRYLITIVPDKNSLYMLG